MVKTRRPAQIVAVRLINAAEVRNYLGEEKYVDYLIKYVTPILKFAKAEKTNCEVFCEISGSIYVIIEDAMYDVQSVFARVLSLIEAETKNIEQTGAKFVPRACLIRYPDDLSTQDEILFLGREFAQIVPYDMVFSKASEVVKSRAYIISSNIDSILSRAITDRKFEVYYQPIYSVKEQRFVSAEALLRLTDEKHGNIPPSVFIPFAESRGLILPVGDIVLESVFHLVSTLDMEGLGLSFIEINLSIAQCIQKDFPAKVKELEEKYGVSAKNINFEITETMYEDLSSIVHSNIKQLKDMGYAISLDDYGVGYSNIHRILKLPLRIVKIDKSLVDGLSTASGFSIFKNTVNMLKDIELELVVEGVETKHLLDQALAMDCDYIQGFYFSKPIPEHEFIDFLRKNNKA
ncbi:MAG: EAL domain-containing protein [Bacillota bacterium]|nr:EAL domain-containing protein [Bacillota bacterium]